MTHPNEATIARIAQELFAAAGSNVAEAAAKLEKRVRTSPKLRSELMEHYVRLVCIEVVGKLGRDDREAAWLPPNYDAGGNGQRVKALAAGNAAMLMDFLLPHGGKLGESRRSDVSAAAAFYLKQGLNMIWKGRWLDVVASHVPSGKKVKNALTEERLRELQKETRANPA